MSLAVSAQRRQEIIDALRRGTVPARSLDAFAVGLDRFEPAVDEELALGARGGSVFKAVRGEYGSGKTFFSRWLQERAKRLGFATAEVQISETETPLHRLETVYRRLIERLSTADIAAGALRSVVDGWFFTLEQDVLADQRPQLEEEEDEMPVRMALGRETVRDGSGGPHAELFLELTSEGCLGRLAVLDLSAREFPKSRQVHLRRTLRDEEQISPPDDCRGNPNNHRASFRYV